MIVKVTAPNSVPTDISDYQAQNAHMMAFIIAMNNQQFVLTDMDNVSIPKIAQGSYIQFGGSLYVVENEDYTVNGTLVEGNNYIRISGGSTLTAEWVSDDSGYTWNYSYNQKTSGAYGMLPYVVVKQGSSYFKKQTLPISAEVSTVHTITASGNFTVQPYSRLFAFCIGGGAGGAKAFFSTGGGGCTESRGGVGGNSGEYSFTELFSQFGETLEITVGSKGYGYGKGTPITGGDTIIKNKYGTIIAKANGAVSSFEAIGATAYKGGLGARDDNCGGNYINAENGKGSNDEKKDVKTIGGYPIEYSIGSGGGGGARNRTAGGKGSSGGGDGGDYLQAGKDATTYGSGGGGGGSPSSNANYPNGGNGGNGLVILVAV